MSTIILPSNQSVIESIGESQDGGKLTVRDIYSRFLLELIRENTVTNLYDAGNVNIDELEDNLRYAIDQFTKAHNVVKKMQTN